MGSRTWWEFFGLCTVSPESELKHECCGLVVIMASFFYFLESSNPMLVLGVCVFVFQLILNRKDQEGCMWGGLVVGRPSGRVFVLRLKKHARKHRITQIRHVIAA